MSKLIRITTLTAKTLPTGMKPYSISLCLTLLKGTLPGQKSHLENWCLLSWLINKARWVCKLIVPAFISDLNSNTFFKSICCAWRQWMFLYFSSQWMVKLGGTSWQRWGSNPNCISTDMYSGIWEKIGSISKSLLLLEKSKNQQQVKSNRGLVDILDLPRTLVWIGVIPLKSSYYSAGKLALEEYFSGFRVESLSLPVNPFWFSSIAQCGCTELTAVREKIWNKFIPSSSLKAQKSMHFNQDYVLELKSHA